LPENSSNVERRRRRGLPTFEEGKGEVSAELSASGKGAEDGAVREEETIEDALD
jgi:hypothetical protein